MYKHDRLIILLLSIGDSSIDKITNGNQFCLYPIHYYLVAFVIFEVSATMVPPVLLFIAPPVDIVAAPPADVMLAAALVIAPPADVILPAIDVIGGECRLSSCDMLG
jgi:hypothetical protein